MKCCTDGCEEPAFIELMDDNFRVCGCLNHFYDAAWAFENHKIKHEHFRYLLFCYGCDDLKHHGQVSEATMGRPPHCLLHPDIQLRFFPLSSDKLFKECVEPTQVIDNAITN